MKQCTTQKFFHHGGAGTTEYWSWAGMKARCYRKTHPKYSQYGGRGIKVSKQWLGKYGFQTFLKDMGKRPAPGYTINRINNNGNYEPSNCEWANANTQAVNKTNSNNVPGVYYDKRYRNQWSMRLHINNIRVAYGRYATEEEAIQARKLAELKWIV